MDEMANEQFAEFVRGRGAALHRTAYLLTGDWALAEDLLGRIQKTGGLLELADPIAPARPEAELQKSDRDLRRGHGVDHADEGLHAGNLAADVLAQHRGLTVGKYVFVGKHAG